MMAHIISILANGFEEIEAVTFVDILRRADIKVTLLGLGSLEITGSHGLTIRTDALFDSFKGTFDGVVLPGGQPGTTNLTQSDKVVQLVRDSFHKGLLVAAICAAPGVLGKAGILEKKLATCYPGVEKNLSGAILSADAVVQDGNIITSRGVGTAIAFALKLVTYVRDSQVASKVSSAILFP
jgi:protein deglycase